MLDGVLDQRLEEERRDQCRKRLRRYALRVPEALFEAESLDLYVGGEQPQLLIYGDFGGVGIERVAEQVTEAGEHALGPGRVSRGERGDGVQGVEQKVGVQLQAQGVELRSRLL